MSLLSLLGIGRKKEEKEKPEEVIREFTKKLDLILLPILRRDQDKISFNESPGNLRRVKGYWPTKERLEDNQRYVEWIFMYEVPVNGEFTSTEEIRLAYVIEPKEERGFRINSLIGPGDKTEKEALELFESGARRAYNLRRGFKVK